MSGQLTETQLQPAEIKWMHGVRVREQFGIDVLEGAKPNAGWLGPEMSGEEGATFKEKLHWAIGEAKARSGACISPASRLHLACISPASRQVRGTLLGLLSCMRFRLRRMLASNNLGALLRPHEQRSPDPEPGVHPH